MSVFLKPTIEITGNLPAEYKEILTPEAIDFLVQLHQNFNEERKKLLYFRTERQEALNVGILPDFLAETQLIRNSDWEVAPLPADLQDRRTEITGPVERKMIINALNSGANCFMADFEDSNSPTWSNLLEGQINLRDAVKGTILYTNPSNQKEYKLNPTTAVLMVRPRGWHLPEKHFLIDNEPIAGALFDFGLYFFHNAHALLKKNTAPYFYLPKLESHLEARLWNSIFIFAQNYLNIPQGTIKATVLIETILAAFEMHEILYELKQHSAGLNCGRWDYIFSFIKKLHKHPQFILPNRSEVTMTTHFLNAYSLLVIQTCHKRKVHAMGGMAAQIPIKNNEQANAAALEKVRSDKEREAKNGHDGTWVAHPALVPIAKQQFDLYMPTPNQIHVMPSLLMPITAADLLAIPKGTITAQGLENNIDVSIQYIANWLTGNGCVPIYNLMEDAATAEIARSQVWQWVNFDCKITETQTTITAKMVTEIAQNITQKLIQTNNNAIITTEIWQQACTLFVQLCTQKQFSDFLTSQAYNFFI